MAVKTLKIRFFEQADEDWLDFVLMCREKRGTPHDCDMVIGPTADDDTMLCLKHTGMAYMEQLVRLKQKGFS